MTDPLPNESNPESSDHDTPVSDASRKFEKNEPSSDASILRKTRFGALLVAAGASLFYALRIESSLFRAIALQLAVMRSVARLVGERCRQRFDANVWPRLIGDKDGLAFKREATAIHYLFVAAPHRCRSCVGRSVDGCPTGLKSECPDLSNRSIGGAILAVLAASLWTALARVVQLHSDAGKVSDLSDEDALDGPKNNSASMPEAAAVQSGTSVNHVSTALLSGAVLMAATVHQPVEGWFGMGA